MTITTEEIARLRALEAKATPGPVTATKQAIKHSSIDDAGRRVTAFVAACTSTTLPNEANAQLLAESRNALLPLLDEIERLQDELLTVRTVYHHRCECSEDDACQFARERDEARAEVARLRADRDSALACKVDADLDALAKESGRSFRDVALMALAHQARRIETVEADLREAVALLRCSLPLSNGDNVARRDALLAKHKGEA